ncbi:ninjurin-2-like isoform X2 [Ostrinia furnacalis]|uniref:ninjurin-2-like isoform X2 n=1 Tax=Ostrinia furnacalis TaxID=93504 RepID=UPI00103BA8AE|nr:ninjurin-2-like isoform X2 [Ostrinia furnacalis]
MADDKLDKRSEGCESESDTPTVNVEEIVVGRNELSAIVKGLDANRYATKKTVAQGMLDIALLTSNASQLKYVLQVGPKHEFYTLLVVLISISIVLQPSAVILNDVIVIFIFASAGVLAIVMTFLDVDRSETEKKISLWLYHTSVGLMTCVVFCDVIKMTFGLDPALSEKDLLNNITSNFYDWFVKSNKPN